MDSADTAATHGTDDGFEASGQSRSKLKKKVYQAELTRLQLDADPEGVVETVGSALGFLDRGSKVISIGSRSSSRPAGPRAASGVAR